MYNHRLYAHYGTARFVRLARRLTAQAPVRLRVMDLFGARRSSRVYLDASPERLRDELAAVPGVEIATDRGDRDRYRGLLAGAHFSIAPFRAGCPWSMSVVDCQGMGLPVLAPCLGWLAEHIDGELLFDTDAEAIALAERLAYDTEFSAVHAKRAHASTAHLAALPGRIKFCPQVAGVNRFNQSPFHAWKAGFRECAMLARGSEYGMADDEVRRRLAAWTAGSTGEFAAAGAREGIAFAREAARDEDFDLLNDPAQLHGRFTATHGTRATAP